MLARYAIAFGHGEHRHALRENASSAGLSKLIDRPEMLVAADQSAPLLVEEGSVLVGRLFSAAHQPLDSLPPASSKSGHGGDPASRLAGCWGNFAWFGVSDQCSWAYRAPSGNMPVYRIETRGGGLFVSDSEVAAAAGLLPDFALDSLFLVHWLQFPFLRTSRTGLAQVRELLPGTIAVQKDGLAWPCSSVWRSATFARRFAAILDPAEAASRLRAAALDIIPAQAGPGRIVVRLSGGLDSSIIAACLAARGADFTCINFHTRAVDGDERQHARSVASMLGVPLHEVAEADLARIDPPSRPGFQPRTNPLLLPFERALGDCAAELGAQLLVDGSGGDNLFFYVTSAAPALDALRWGRPRQAASTLADLAALADCTLWDALRAAARRSVKARPTWKEDRSFLRPGLLLRRREVHPWLHGGRRIPPGQREHVESLVHIHHFLDRGSGDVPLLHPLMAEPLLELCLRIPSWLWVRGGRDRAVARDAFAGLLPRSVLERRDKGSMQSIFHRAFERLRGEMQDILMSGELRGTGIIDTNALEAAFASDLWRNDVFQLRISELVALDLWLSAWRSRRGLCASLP